MKISQLSNAGTITGSEVFPIVQGGTTKKVSITDALAGAGGGSTGVNGLNGTTDIGLGGTLINNTNIDANNFALTIYNLNFGSRIIKTNDSFNYLKAGLEFPYVDETVRLFSEDINTGINYSFQINNNSAQIFQSNTGILGLFINFSNSDCYFGYNVNNVMSIDAPFLFFNGTNGNVSIKSENNGNVYLGINITDFNSFLSNGSIESGIKVDGTSVFYTASTGGNIDGIRLELASRLYQVGNIDLTNNGIQLLIDDNGSFLKLMNGGDIGGLKLDYNLNEYTLGEYNGDYFFKYTPTRLVVQGIKSGFESTDSNSKIGDVAENGNSTKFGVDDNGETLTASANLITGGTHSNSGDHLKINVNGTDYVIQLLNP